MKRRGFVIALAYLIFCVIYLGAAKLAIGPPHALQPSSIDNAVPFLPWTITIYLSQFALLFLALWLSRDKRMLVAIGVATNLSAVIFIAWPTTLPRPGVHNPAFAALYLFDVPTNCFPSLHVALAFIAAAMWPRRSTRMLAWVWAAAIAVSTLTTRQHVAVDIAGGLLVGASGVAVAYRPHQIWKGTPPSANTL
jgi:membrane-associated phospholipid phosphatase